MARRLGRKTPQEKLREILELCVEKPNGCLIWQGSVDEKGYGYIKFGGEVVRAHRHYQLYHIDRTEEQVENLKEFRLKNTCGLTICVRHWVFTTSKPERAFESTDALEKMYASYL